MCDTLFFYGEDIFKEIGISCLKCLLLLLPACGLHKNWILLIHTVTMCISITLLISILWAWPPPGAVNEMVHTYLYGLSKCPKSWYKLFLIKFESYKANELDQKCQINCNIPKAVGHHSDDLETWSWCIVSIIKV